jgi:hypothetical protein
LEKTYAPQEGSGPLDQGIEIDWTEKDKPYRQVVSNREAINEKRRLVCD